MERKSTNTQIFETKKTPSSSRKFLKSKSKPKKREKHSFFNTEVWKTKKPLGFQKRREILVFYNSENPLPLYLLKKY